MPASVTAVGQWHLVTLSGPDMHAIDELSASLARSLAGSGSLPAAIEKIQGEPGPVRRAVIARDAEHCARVLADPAAEPGLLITGQVDPAASVVLMFPGVGDQRPGMTLELYERVPAFRSDLDTVAELLRPHLGLDIRPLLHTGGDEPAGLDIKALRRRDSSSVLTQTRLAQPIVFAVEYCLTRLLLSWGIRPAALCGYSIGEYVAACVAGVLPIEDALALVARRAALIEDVPPGAMLVAMLSPTAITEHLGDDTWLAAINGRNLCVVSGTRSAIAGMAERLTTAGVATLPAPARHGFHSPLMSPVSRPLESLLSQSLLKPPSIPVLSNVTGGWLSPEDACSAAYWARHLCQPVRFHDNLTHVWQQPGTMPVEVGPGQMLTSLANQHADRPRTAETTVLSTLTTRGDGYGEVVSLLAVLANAWVRGACPSPTATSTARGWVGGTAAAAG